MPVCRGKLSFLVASTRAFVTWKSATAGNSMGAYSRLVCSYRMAPVATTTSPDWTFRSIPPQVPVRMNVSAPHLWSSSIAMEAEGPPMPVEQAVTFSPSRVPVQTLNSRLYAICLASSNRAAMAGTRPGSPGRMQ